VAEGAAQATPRGWRPRAKRGSGRDRLCPDNRAPTSKPSPLSCALVGCGGRQRRAPPAEQDGRGLHTGRRGRRSGERLFAPSPPTRPATALSNMRCAQRRLSSPLVAASCSLPSHLPCSPTSISTLSATRLTPTHRPPSLRSSANPSPFPRPHREQAGAGARL
jgi:hypothetical protein